MSFEYLHQTPKAAKLLSILRNEVAKTETPCSVDPDKWTNDELPTDREAQLMCAPCPLREMCLEYAQEAHASWGVWGGTVRGRKLKEAMEDGG